MSVVRVCNPRIRSRLTKPSRAASPHYIAILLLCASGPLAAKDTDICGTFATNTQQELFLHRRGLLTRARADALRTATTTFSQDFGNIAVIDDANGVIARRNPFNLDRRTVTYVPTQAGYRVEVGEDSFDIAAMQAGTRITPLTDDDSRRIALPFTFRFFGKDYAEAWVNSNGTVTFTRGDTDFSGTFGHFAAGPPAIAGLFTDLDPSRTPDGVRVLSEPSRVVVSWSNVPLAGSTLSGQSFQIRIYNSGRIEVAYRGSNPNDATVGITAGSLAPVDLIAFLSSPSNTFANGVAEVFVSADEVDIVAATQRFYQTHQDAYDYVVLYNAAGVRAGAGTVAFEVTTRSQIEGIGDVAVEEGADFGSKGRLKAVLNMGPLSQYPMNPHGTVSSRGPIGDTPVTLIAHETGHLFLALVSVPDPSITNSTPMLTSDRAHWAFPFNSEASVMGAERIRDNGVNAIPRFTTTATVEGYGPLDQYLMGFRSIGDVPPSFVVLNSGSASRTPQTGVNFGGNPLEVTASAIQDRYGRRVPDSTVSQRRFQFGFVAIVPAGSSQQTIKTAVDQIEPYRTEFEKFYAEATSRHAVADTALRKSVSLTLAPAAGLVENTEGWATLELEDPVTEPTTFTLRRPNNVVLTPAFVIVPAGSRSVSFPVFPGRAGVEELTVVPSNPAYETIEARVQVNPLSALRVAVAGSRSHVEDRNHLPYANVSVRVEADGVARTLVSGVDGTVAIPDARNLSISLAAFANPPRIDVGGVVDAVTYASRITSGYVSIFGHGLDGARLRVNGVTITPLYNSDRQVNFVAPAALSSPSSVSVETTQGIALATF